MKFCPKCGTLLRLKQVRWTVGGLTETRITYTCDKCGHTLKPERMRPEGESGPNYKVPVVKVVDEKDASWPEGWGFDTKVKWIRFLQTGKCEHPHEAEERIPLEDQNPDRGAVTLVMCGICDKKLGRER